MSLLPPSSKDVAKRALYTLAPSFVRVLVTNITGLVIVLGLVLLGIMVWQGVSSTKEASRQEVLETLDRGTERIKILIKAAELTADSAERVVRFSEVTPATLRERLESALSAFEQRPELSYLGIVLPETGEYGNLERTASGQILLWLFPGKRVNDQVTRNYILTNNGFVLNEQHPSSGYDPRVRPFYIAALNSPTQETWLNSYQWIIHYAKSEPLWGISYVRALRNSSGRLIGVLDTDLDLPAINNFMNSLNKGYQTQFQIIELGATPRIICDSKVKRIPLPPPKELLPLDQYSNKAFVGKMDMDGEKRWVAARRITLKGGISWLVVASRKDALIELPLRQQLYQIVAMGLVLVIGLALISAHVARRLCKPLSDLEQRVSNILGGGADVPSKTNAKGFNEILLLDKALDNLTSAVHQLLEAKEHKAASLALKGAIFDCSNIAILSLSSQQTIIEWNNAAESMFGLSREQVLGQPITQVVKSAHGAIDWSQIATILGPDTLTLIGAQNAFDAELRVASFKQSGLELHTLFINDISERKRATAALRESLDRFYAAARATGDIVWDWNLADGRIWWNENFESCLGYLSEDIDPTIESWVARIHPDDRDRVAAKILTIQSGELESCNDKYRFLRKNGEYANLLIRGHLLYDDEGRGIRVVGAIQDITERMLSEQHIRYLATHDGLTGLPNRELMLEHIIETITEARKSNTLFALLYLDLDRFKIINDGYGHTFGDEVLKATAHQLASLATQDCIIARQGGDEFLILLKNLNSTDKAYTIANTIITNLDRQIVVDERLIHVSVSIGISLFPQDGESPEALIDHADVAMYQAKGVGRNTFQYFTNQMNDKLQRHVELENQLRNAITKNQLHLVYQPKVNLKSGKICGCEALLRWQHPELGMVSPAEFIPIAEESGLILPIGDWVLRSACLQAKSWLDAGLQPMCVAVNISVRQFLHQDVSQWVMEILTETGLDPNLLELELTESLIAQDTDKVIETFSQLKAIGVKLSIDDFGTGYSSLSYLKRFRVDTLKIDQAFVRDMLTDPDDATIVLAVISLAHNLGFNVIAEGVETEAHCIILRQNHCDEIQGYYFSKPLLAAKFGSLLSSGKQLLLKESPQGSLS